MATVSPVVSAPAFDSAPPTPGRLPTRTVIAYGLPILGVGLMWNMLGFYFLKFSTDQLLLAPGLIGLIFGMSRVWDAVSDPLAGYLSDRTVTRLGRRRPWILASALPLGLCFIALWTPPAAVVGNDLVVWVAFFLFLFFTAITAFRIPHQALGAELSSDYHDRTRLFASAGIHEALGGLMGIGLLAALFASNLDPRLGLPGIALFVALASLGLIGAAVHQLREPAQNLARGPSDPWATLRDIWANPHARRLMLVKFFQTSGMICTVTSVPYFADYVYGNEAYMSLFLLAFIVPALTGIPLAASLSRRYGKRRVFNAARTFEGLMFGALFFAPSMPLGLMLSFVALAGSVDGIAGVLSGSIGADIVDYDESRSGERKEGAYFSFWSLGEKLAIGIAIPIVGACLELSGFEPGAAQSQTVLLTIRALLALAPLVFLLLGVLLMLRFSLDEREHTRIRGVLNAAKSGEQSS